MHALKRIARRAIKAMLKPLSDRWVYTARSGLAKGMRIKGGFLFLPKPLPKEATLLEEIAPELRGKVVYDIGANVGLTTLFFARCVGQEGLVIAFEPVSDVAWRLRENVRINRLRNVRIYEVALGDQETQSAIHFTPEASGIATFRHDMAQQYHREYRLQACLVEVVRLDTIVRRESLPLPHFIKIDVEGFEYQVLQGAQGVIEQSHPQIFLELHGSSVEDCRQMWGTIYRFLSEHGYSIISPAKNPITEANLLEEGNLWYCRYISSSVGYD